MPRGCAPRQEKPLQWETAPQNKRKQEQPPRAETREQPVCSNKELAQLKINKYIFLKKKGKKVQPSRAEFKFYPGTSWVQDTAYSSSERTAPKRLGRSWFIHYFSAGKYLQSIIHLGKRLSTAGHKEQIFSVSDVSTFLYMARCRNLGSLTFFLRHAWSYLGVACPQYRASPPMGTFLPLSAQSVGTAIGCNSTLVELSAEQSLLSSMWASVWLLLAWRTLGTTGQPVPEALGSGQCWTYITELRIPVSLEPETSSCCQCPHLLLCSLPTPHVLT